MNATEHRVLAFANDLCLIQDSLAALQHSLEAVREDLRSLGLQLNPAKCSMLYDGSTSGERKGHQISHQRSPTAPT